MERGKHKIPKQYIIESSIQGQYWYAEAVFHEGQKSRYNDAPFTAELALKEAKGFKEYRNKKHVRVIIEL